MRVALALLFLAACSGPSSSPDTSARDASSPIDANDASSTDEDAHVDHDAGDVDSGESDSGSDAAVEDADVDAYVVPVCDVVAQTGCESMPGWACRFSGAEDGVVGTGPAQCEGAGGLPERGLLPTGICFTRESDGNYVDLCMPGFFCAGARGCRRYCDAEGATCPNYCGPDGSACGCDGAGTGCAQTCNTISESFPGAVGFCDG